MCSNDLVTVTVAEMMAMWERMFPDAPVGGRNEPQGSSGTAVVTTSSVTEGGGGGGTSGIRRSMDSSSDSDDSWDSD